MNDIDESNFGTQKDDDLVGSASDFGGIIKMNDEEIKEDEDDDA